MKDQKKKVITLQLLALKHKLRAMYWSVEIDDHELDTLKQMAGRDGLMIASDSPRLVYHPAMVTNAEITRAFARKDTTRVGELFGYPSAGDEWERWWVSWQVRDPKRAGVFTDLFNFQMKRLDTRALVRMKRRWNTALPMHYFDFEIRYRENRRYDDVA